MPDNDDLRFFGAVCASVSHELKNVLAVMHEQAGLLGDLALMAERGMPLDPCRLAAAADCLLKQIRRGDAILTHINNFAHTTDPPAPSVNLAKTAALAVGLCRRRAEMRQVCLAAEPGEAAPVAGDPFLAVRLLAACLDRAMDAPGAEKTIRVAARNAPHGPAVTLTGLDPAAALPDDDALHALAASLGARLCRDAAGLSVVWPGA
ncbi:MAG: sensor histidine kinase [Solidesulfovibrio sp. DCME]|uniref:sensor histidine kinase n=1 Tax=Solidesulfovibrio sp. DCME TaxID=3447380 RepID=UPI003D1473CD